MDAVIDEIFGIQLLGKFNCPRLRPEKNVECFVLFLRRGCISDTQQVEMSKLITAISIFISVSEGVIMKVSKATRANGNEMLSLFLVTVIL